MVPMSLPLPWLLTAIVVLGVGAQWLAWRLRLPAIVLLLAIGVLVGPVSGLLNPDELLGEALFPLASLAVAIILFEGSLTLRFEEIHGLRGPIWSLVSLGAAINLVLISAAAYYFLGAPVPIALLIGSICCVTGPTVVGPMLRAIRPRANIDKVLRWEGIIVDPIGAVLAVLALELALSGYGDRLWWQLGRLILSGCVFGFAFAFAIGFCLKRHWIPWYLRSAVILALVLLAFTSSDQIAHESGLLTVTIMGVVLANLRDVDLEDVLHVKETLTVMLVSLLFILLAARLDFSSFSRLGWGLPLFLIAVLFVARTLAVGMSTLRSRLSWKERALVAWIGPRGIVAAAVGSLFALRLESAGVPGGELLVPAVFSVIIASVLLQSFTARRLALRLGLAEAVPKGVLLIGSSHFARAFGQALKAKGFRVLMADVNWDSLSKARMAGLDTYFGRIVSEHAERHLDTSAVARLFALASRPNQNALACLHFRSELGTDGVFALRTAEDKSHSKGKLAGQLRTAWLFRKDVSHAELEAMLDQGGRIRSHKIKDDFGLKEFRLRYPNALGLVGISPRQQLQPFTQLGPPPLKPGWELLALHPKDQAEESTTTGAQSAGAISPGTELSSEPTLETAGGG
jgi:NhaP-type Na+/H+ or K+/H+ antiporter